MSKSSEIVRLMESRLRVGDFVREGVPSEEALATDVGVSRMTARKVLLELERRGVVVRNHTGRRTFAKRVQDRAPRQVAVLRQAWMDRASAQSIREMRGAAGDLGLQLRTIEFLHWDDPVITQTLVQAERDADSPGEGIAGILIVPPAEPMPETLIRRLAEAPTRVVVETLDLSERGIPSIQTVHPDALVAVLDHLARLGPGAIDCFNTQPEDPGIIGMLEAFDRWHRGTGRDGIRFSRPVASYDDSVEQARRVGVEYFQLRSGRLPRAIFCLTEAAAMGLMRCAADLGVRVGQDVAVAALKDSGHATYLVPSLTCVRRSPRNVMYRKCLQWIAGGEDWSGPRLITPQTCELFVGESSSCASRNSIA
ncbi:MAG: substrate-binding domain-containing protein [Planctomycetota bacterium]